MSIIYSLIARVAQDKTPVILTSYDTASGNYPQIVVNLLKQIQQQNLQKTFIYNSQFNFHVFKQMNMIYMIMADASFNRQLAFLFLQQLMEKFIAKFSQQRIKVAISFALAPQFEPIYRNLINYYNKNPGTDKKNQLSQQLGQLKLTLSDNIQKLLQRDTKITILVNRTNHLDDLATNLKGNAIKMRNDAFWRNNKCKIFIGGAILTALLALILII